MTSSGAGDRFADDSRSGDDQALMMTRAIGLNQRLGPVVFQNIGLGRGNGLTAQRYVNQMLIRGTWKLNW